MEGSDNGEVGFGGVGSMLGKAQHSDSKGRAKVKMKAKNGDGTTKGHTRGHACGKGGGGDSGVVGMLAVCSLGVVANVVGVWHRW